MCQFKSAIVLRDKRNKGGFQLLMSPWTESHSELITMHKLNDGKMLHFARVEFSPDSMSDAHLVEKYKLKIDEQRTPDWFDEEMKEAVSAKMASYIKSIIVTSDNEFLIGGQFIVAPNCKVFCKFAFIAAALGNSTVKAWDNSTVNAWDNSTVKAWDNSTVKAWDNSTIEAYNNSIVIAYGNSTVKAWDNSTVNAWDNSTVKAYNNSIVIAYGNSTVKAWDNSTVNAWDNSTVKAYGESTVKDNRNKK
jgi:hypothetical protein